MSFGDTAAAELANPSTRAPRTMQIHDRRSNSKRHTFSLKTSTSGDEKTINAPLRSPSAISTCPPWARIATSTNTNPKPCPVECCPFTKRSKARPRALGEKPWPLSSTVSSACPLPTPTVTRMQQPGGRCDISLSRRLVMLRFQQPRISVNAYRLVDSTAP